MALKVGDLFYGLSINDRQAQKALGRTEKSVGRVSSSFKVLGGLIAAAFTIDLAAKTLRMADNLKLLDERIKSLTNSEEEFIKVQQRLIQTASDVGGELERTVALFDSLNSVAPELGATTDQILSMVDSVQKLGVIGATSITAQGFAITQFSQAMAGGILRAEEFNSIVENTPKLAAAIAKGMGVTRGELRMMVIDGKVLASDVFGAILSQTEAINTRFEEIPVTMERATGMFNIAWGQYIKDADKSLEVTEFIAEAIQSAAKGIEKGILPSAAEMKEPFLVIADLWGIIVADLDNATEGMTIISDITQFLQREFGFLLGLVGDFADLLKSGPIAMREEFTKLFGVIDRFFTEVGAKAKLFALNFTVGDTSKLEQQIKDRLKIELDASRMAVQMAKDEATTRRNVVATASRERLDIARREATEKRAIELEAKQKDSKEVFKKIETTEEEEGPVSKLEKIQAQMGDETQEILNQFAIRNAAILDLDQISAAQRDALLKKSGEIRLKAQENLAKKEIATQSRKDMMTLGVARQTSSSFLALLKAAGKEQSAAGKALFFADRALAVVQILMNTQVQAAKAGAQTGLFGIPISAAIIASGVAQAATVAALTFSGGRLEGGPVSAGSIHPINEDGKPEVLEIRGRQHLIPGKDGKVISNKDAFGGGGVTVNVINNAAVEVDVQQIERGEIQIMIDQSATRVKNDINAELSQGRGSTSRALNKGFGIGRNITL